MAVQEIVDLGGPVHLVDHGGEGRLLLLVHGLEGSHLNWMVVAPALAERRRVIAPDLRGFGLTPPGERGSSVEANADLVAELARKYGDGPATVVGNSMGGLVAMLAATRHPDVVDRLVLVNPALAPTNRMLIHPEVLLKLGGPAIPTVGPRLVELYQRTHTPERHSMQSFAFVCADPESVDPAVVAASLEMTKLRRTMPWAVAGFSEAARSIARYTLGRRRFSDLVHRVSQPTLMIHGGRDRLVPIESAHAVAAMRPDWELSVWDDVGHVPMIEDPDRFTAEVLGFLPVARA